MKQNKNLLSSRLTENRIDDQNIIQSNTDLSNQKSSAPISDKKQYKTWGKRKKKEEPAYFQYADFFKFNGSKSGRLCRNSR